MSRGKELAKNTLILSVGTFLPKFTLVITLPIITGHLTKTEYGTYDLITTLISLVLPVVTLQIQAAAFRFLIECRNDLEEKKRVITNIFLFLLPVSFISGAFLFSALFSITKQTRVLIAVYFFVDVLSRATGQIVRGLSMNKLYSMGSIIQAVFNLILVVVTLSIGNKGLNGLLISIIISSTINVIVLFLCSDIKSAIDAHYFSFSVIKKMLNYSWPLIPNTLSNWVLSTSDRLVLTIFCGLETVAIYGVANKIPNLLLAIQATFAFAWQENASLAVSDNDSEKYYSEMFDRFFCIICGILMLLIATSPLLFKILIKGDYKDAFPQMTILFIGVFFSTLSTFLGGIYIAHKRTKSVGLTTILAAGINLGLDFSLVNSLGIYAASISTVASYIFLVVYRMHSIKKFQSISFRYKRICFCIGVLIIMCVLCRSDSLASMLVNMFIGVGGALLLNHSMIKLILNTV